MNRRLFLLGLFGLFRAALPAFAAAAPPASAVTATITGVRDHKGVVRVLLFADEKGFPSDEKKAVGSQIADLAALGAGELAVTITFKNLPPGTYAVCVVHDANNNGKMDTHWYGKPREGFAVSNNPGGRRPPRFKDARFTLGGEPKTVLLQMRYL